VSYSIEEVKFPITSFTAKLRFSSREIDPSSGEPEDNAYDDEYEIDAFELLAGDYIVPNFITDFDKAWDKSAKAQEATDVFQLSEESIQEVCKAVIRLLSLKPLEGTEQVFSTSTSTHTLKLSGNTITNEPIFALAKMASSKGNGVTLQLSVRSPSIETSTFTLSAFC